MRARSPKKSRRRLAVSLGVVGIMCAISVTPVWGSIFGEENTTLVHMLVQLFQIESDMSEANKVANEVAGAAKTLLGAYQEVNAGINQIKNYGFDAFLNDVKVDLYRQYPGFAKLEGASKNLAQWEGSFSSSPFTAYDAIGAVVGDVSKPLKDAVGAGAQNLDEELLLKGEAAGGLAAAYTAEQVTEKFDRQIKDLAQLAQNASPAQAAQIAARSGVMLAAQQSYVMRLLSRTVRLHSVDSALEYGRRIHARNSSYEQRDATIAFAREALKPPPLINFASDGTAPPSEQPLDPYPATASAQTARSAEAQPSNPTSERQ